MSAMGGAEWFFVPQNPNYDAAGLSFALGGSGFQREELLVRESIQNGVDATVENAKTEMEFRLEGVSSERADAFHKLLRLDTEASPLRRLDRLGLSRGNFLERLGSRRLAGSSVAIISDWDTVGLGYDARDGKDRFDRLCLSFGPGAAVAEGKRGGSHGFGKAVYEYASDCNMFLVYSVFEPSDKTVYEPRCHARFFACATFDEHDWDGRKYMGRALFGRVVKDKYGDLRCRPLCDDEAHAVAKQLGFEPRNRDDKGTSIMILGAGIDMDAVRNAVEKYWWPRINENELGVDLMKDGQLLDVQPEPKDNDSLKSYIDCYEIVTGNEKPKSREKLYRFSRIRGQQLGKVAFKGLPDNPDQDDKDKDGSDDLTGTVALIRSGPKMVVKYLDTGGGGSFPYVGTFVSHADAEDALHLSEPPAHNDWDPDSERIIKAYSDDPDAKELAIRMVKGTLSRVRRRSHDFRQTLTPPPKTNPGGSRDLARMLSGMMSSRAFGRRSPPSPRTQDPFEIRIAEFRNNTNSQSTITSKVRLKLKSAAGFDSANVVVSVTPSLVIDDNLRRDSAGKISVASITVDNEPVAIENGYETRIAINKYDWVTVEAVSEPFASDLYASLDVSTFMPSNEIGQASTSVSAE